MKLREEACELRRIQTGLGCQFLQRAALQDVVQLIGGDGQVLTSADSGRNYVAQAPLLKHLQTSDATHLRIIDEIDDHAEPARGCCDCTAPPIPAIARTSSNRPMLGLLLVFSGNSPDREAATAVHSQIYAG
jgi:hypothetical protein